LAISHFKKANQALIASEDQYVVYDFGSKSVVETIISKKKSGGQVIPTLIDISCEDTYSIESASQTVLFRNLKSKQLIVKYEGHLHPVSNISFVSNGTSLVFLTSSESECLLWNPKEQLKGAHESLVEVSQPDKILDLASSDSVTALSVREIS
jgi:WD40 repeat protein